MVCGTQSPDEGFRKLTVTGNAASTSPQLNVAAPAGLLAVTVSSGFSPLTHKSPAMRMQCDADRGDEYGPGKTVHSQRLDTRTIRLQQQVRSTV
jgi:hypothetical protein